VYNLPGGNDQLRHPADYTKIRKIAECIDHELSKSKQIRVVDLNRHLEFDGDRHVRFLARRGFLQPVKDKEGKICAWIRSGNWPPPAEFFQARPFGFARYLQTWFRYYLQAWIEKRQSELEAKEGVYTYDFRGGRSISGSFLRAGNQDVTFIRSGSEEVAQPGGRRSITHAERAERPLTDNEMASRPFDIPQHLPSVFTLFPSHPRHFPPTCCL
jgi:hypothetical protein